MTQYDFKIKWSMEDWYSPRIFKWSYPLYYHIAQMSIICKWYNQATHIFFRKAMSPKTIMNTFILCSFGELIHRCNDNQNFVIHKIK